MNFKQSKLCCLIAFVCILDGFSAPAYAITTIEENLYEVKSGSLNEVLINFKKQSNMELEFDKISTSKFHSKGITGRYSIESGLLLLLEGTPFIIKRNDTGSYKLENESKNSTNQKVTIITDASSFSRNSSIFDVSLNPIRVKALAELKPEDMPYRSANANTYLSAEQIEKNRGTSVGDFLKGVAGVLNSDNRNSGALDVNIRGMQGQGRVPVIVDGAFQETTIYRGYSGIAGRTYIDPDLIGGVEIEKGASGAADANGATGGIIRINTIKAKDIINPGSKVGARITAGISNNNSSPPTLGTKGGNPSYMTFPFDKIPNQFGDRQGMQRPSDLNFNGWNGSVALAIDVPELEFLAALAHRDQGNYYAGKKGDNIPKPEIKRRGKWATVSFNRLTPYRAGEEVLNTSQDNISYLLKTKYKWSDRKFMEFIYNQYSSEYGEIMPSSLVRFGQPYQGYLNKIDVNSYSTHYHFDPEETPWVNLNFNGFYTRSLSRIHDSTPLTKLSVGRYYNQSDRWGGSLDNKTDFLDKQLQISYGFGYQLESIGFPRKFNFDVSKDPTFREGLREEKNAFTRINWRPYNNIINIEGNLRYSGFRVEDKKPIFPELIFENDGGWHMSKDKVEYAGSSVYKAKGWSPMLSVILEPNNGFQLFGKYSSTIRLPSLFESTSGWSTPAAGLKLSPERANTWEIGTNLKYDSLWFDHDSLRVKLNYFDTKVDNYLTRVDRYVTPKLLLAGIENIDYAAFRGVELSTKYDIGNIFGHLEWSRYLDSNFCMSKDSKSISGVRCFSGGVPNSYAVNQLPPKETIALILGSRILDKKLELGASYNHISNRPTSGLGGSMDNKTGGTLVHVEWKPFHTLDLFTSYKWNDQIKLFLGIDNITNQYYLDPLAMGLMPGPGRTIRSSISYKF